jgi:hypothetical protein
MVEWRKGMVTSGVCSLDDSTCNLLSVLTAGCSTCIRCSFGFWHKILRKRKKGRNR